MIMEQMSKENPTFVQKTALGALFKKFPRGKSAEFWLT
jgi:hypothetical protein